MSDRPNHQRHLWILAIAPVIWLVHLLASYVTVAIFCAKVAGPSGALGAARVAVVVYTAAALGGILVLGLRSYRRHRFGGETMPYDFETREERERFLGFAALLLALLSGVGVIYVALAIAFVGTCR